MVLNRSKKSEVEEYKIQKANKCFDLAQECIKKSCGDTALILINRVRQLNPKKEGLEKIEALAQVTFISISKQKKAFCIRAEALLQANRAEEAVRLLKPLEEKPIYKFSLSNETRLPIFPLYCQGMSSNYRYLINKSLDYNEFKSYEVWDIEKQAKIDQIYADNLIDFVYSKESVGFIDGRKIKLYNFVTKKIRTIDLEYLGIYDKKSLENDCTGSDSVLFLREIPQMVLVMNDESQVELGFIITIKIVKLKSYQECIDGYLWNSSIEDPRNQGLKTRRVICLLSLQGEFKQIQESELVLPHEECLKAHFPKMTATTKRDTWNGRWPSFGKDHPVRALELPYDKREVGRYRNRILAVEQELPYARHAKSVDDPYRMILAVEHPIQADGLDQPFYFFDIQYRYVQPKDLAEIDFYQTLLRVSVLGNDFESYVNAMEHLVGFHHQNRSWRALEELMLNLSGHSAPIREKIVQAIKEAETSDDNFWASRLHLLLGLFQKPLPLKKETYKRALQLNPDDPAAASALEFVKALKLDQALLVLPETVDTSEVQELKAKIQKQQEQIEKQQSQVDKLQELVDKLLAKK